MRSRGEFACIAIPVFSIEINHVAEESPQLELEFPSPDPGPDKALQTKQEKARIHRFVSSLSVPDQDVVRRRYWEDQPQVDIARSLNVSEAAISKRLKKVAVLGRATLADLKNAN